MASFDELDEIIMSNVEDILDDGQLFVFCDGWHVWFETADWINPALEFVSVATVPPSKPGPHLVEPMRCIGFTAEADGFIMHEPVRASAPACQAPREMSTTRGKYDSVGEDDAS